MQQLHSEYGDIPMGDLNNQNNNYEHGDIALSRNAASKADAAYVSLPTDGYVALPTDSSGLNIN